MSDCDKYAELISCLVDGELEDDKRSELEAHMAQCPECAAMYQDFMFIRFQVCETRENVPDHLHERLMQQVRETPIKKKKPILRVLRPYVAAAACLVVIVSAVLTMQDGMGKSENTTFGAAMNMYALQDDAACNSMPTEGAYGYSSGDTNSYDGYDSASNECYESGAESCPRSAESSQELSQYILQQLIPDQTDTLTAEDLLCEFDISLDYSIYFDNAVGAQLPDLNVFCACPDVSQLESALEILEDLYSACIEKGYKDENILIIQLDDDYLVFALGSPQQISLLCAQAEELFQCNFISALS